jgi:hypothetical protein
MHDEVSGFLARNGFLEPLLIDTWAESRKYFPSSQAFLEVDVDPDEGLESLSLVLEVDIAPDQALKLLEVFDSKWWLPNLDRARGKLGIHLEFV